MWVWRLSGLWLYRTHSGFCYQAHTTSRHIQWLWAPPIPQLHRLVGHTGQVSRFMSHPCIPTTGKKFFKKAREQCIVCCIQLVLVFCKCMASFTATGTACWRMSDTTCCVMPLSLYDKNHKNPIAEKAVQEFELNLPWTDSLGGPMSLTLPYRFKWY